MKRVEYMITIEFTLPTRAVARQFLGAHLDFPGEVDWRDVRFRSVEAAVEYGKDGFEEVGDETPYTIINFWTSPAYEVKESTDADSRD